MRSACFEYKKFTSEELSGTAQETHDTVSDDFVGMKRWFTVDQYEVEAFKKEINQKGVMWNKHRDIWLL